MSEQFPQWSHLPVRPVELSGWDNRTFHLGDEMSVRLPSAERYARKVRIEQEWLPRLAPRLSVRIPEPLAMGQPSNDYPWYWSVYRWLEGKNADTLENIALEWFAADSARFLNELHTIDLPGGPAAGSHNFYRGACPSVYSDETTDAIAALKDIIDGDSAMAVWETAISSKWRGEPAWIHGDFSAGNILVKDGSLAAVIDFGGMGVGDPACDLVLAWTFLTGQSREIFKAHITLDHETWARARGWALWKALITLVPLDDYDSAEALRKRRVIDDLCAESPVF